MIFQEFVREVCDGKPGEAARCIEGATGKPIGYARAHRWYRNPSPISLPFARVIVQGTDGKCTLEELIDPEIIAAKFVFEPEDAATERKFLAQRMQARERELKQLMAARRLGRTIETVERELKQLKARWSKLDSSPPPRRRGRPAADAVAPAPAPSAAKKRRRPVPAAAA